MWRCTGLPIIYLKTIIIYYNLLKAIYKLQVQQNPKQENNYSRQALSIFPPISLWVIWPCCYWNPLQKILISAGVFFTPFFNALNILLSLIHISEPTRLLSI